MSAIHLSTRYRTAFVTGASTGLGRAFTDMLLAQGVEVWGTARDTIRLPARPGFHAVAEFYDDFREVSDDEVVRLLDRPTP